MFSTSVIMVVHIPNMLRMVTASQTCRHTDIETEPAVAGRSSAKEQTCRNIVDSEIQKEGDRSKRNILSKYNLERQGDVLP
jgi:hypothetical protein